MAEILRSDYRAPSHLIDTVHLEFDLDLDSTSVTNTMRVRPNPDAVGLGRDLVLNGETLTLVSVAVDGVQLEPNRYAVTEKSLTIFDLSRDCDVTVVNRFNPSANKALSGIYSSGRNLMSQCEAEGFRRITYYLDRPDVLARFFVVIRASKDQFPVLLSNGNRLEEKDLGDGRHEVRWEDPFPKPCYLFALVAGNLVCRREEIELKNGKKAELEIWVEPQDLEKTAHTMESLKKAIRWDEDRWGLELDLEGFRIVATNDFNFGAMENKGLNIFNARYALANPNVATDQDYANIESVVGHEYFHNWTGDRITLRDWFQLTLKEGLTVFRDQEFSADMLGDASARAVERIRNVKALRIAQFAEDAGPMAHPIRPESYQEINNFYTSTVYDKGAEVIRMLQTLLGSETFRKGFDLYISRNDGKAVTCEAFLEAMEEAAGRSLEQFRLWYSQAGTPRVTVSSLWDEASRTFTVTAEQTTPPTPGQPSKAPLLMPFPVSLIAPDGREMPALLADEPETAARTNRMFELSEAVQSWTFTGLSEKPVLSLNRGYAAPVIIDCSYSDAELALLAAHDSDPFSRWEAMHRLMLKALVDQVRADLLKTPTDVSPVLLEAFGTLIDDRSLSPAYRAVAMELPSEREIGDALPLIDPAAVHRAREKVRHALGMRWLTKLEAVIADSLTPGDYSPDSESAGRRALKNTAHFYTICTGNKHAMLAVRDQFMVANNLTDRLAALSLVSGANTPVKTDFQLQALQEWLGEPLLVNKWLTIQALSPYFTGETPVLERIEELVKCDFFSLSNPNNVYALLVAFFLNNPSEFHRRDGSGYGFWAQTLIELDKLNPQVASRVARCLENWRRYTPELSNLMYQTLCFMQAREDLSGNVREIIEKALNNPA
ncbi:MAG: aminopeptidase N [Sutterella sp.]|nr:aminopeptidase N [Sutterella sp.]